MKPACSAARRPETRRHSEFEWGGSGRLASRGATERELGFSVLELLLVVVILLILTTLYWGSGSANRGKLRQKSCAANLERIFIAMEIYANDSRGSFPARAGAATSAQALSLLVPRYTSDTAAFICPGSKDKPLPPGADFPAHKISYAYYAGRTRSDPTAVLMTDQQVDTSSKLPGQPLFSGTGQPPGNNHGARGGNLLFCDGHVAGSPANAAVALPTGKGVNLLNP